MTGFTVSAFLSRNRVSPKEAFEGLELCERKLSCTVLRGLDGSNPVRLLGNLLGNPCAKGDNHSSVALGDHELISFQCHLDTLRYVEDTAFQSCWSSR